MEIRKVRENKKQYLPLLLLGDEQESMIDRYLENGTLYILEDGDVKALCVVLEVDAGVLELKNIAVEPAFQGRGYGRQLIEFLCQTYKGVYETLLWGPGTAP